MELKYPKKVRLGDITVRDGFQHEENFIRTEAKLFYLEELILCGFKRLEVTNFGNPKGMPQFKDADELMKQLRNSKKLTRAGVNWDNIELTVVTIRERSIDRAIEAKKEGWGPDRILMMVSTDEEHHFANSGASLPAYWKEAERCIKKASEAGINVGHFHVTRGWGLANVLAALQAGIDIFEGTMGGLGGQPTNFIDGVPVTGTGAYYYRDPNIVGLSTMEDMVVMMDEMGIETGINVDRLLELGIMMEKTIGRRLRSEAILNGRIPKKPREEFKRKGLPKVKEKLGERTGQIYPEGWPERAQYKPQ
jgi:hydroxymethylglutaryl-CoA lyase